MRAFQGYIKTGYLFRSIYTYLPQYVYIMGCIVYRIVKKIGIPFLMFLTYSHHSHVNIIDHSSLILSTSKRCIQHKEYIIQIPVAD